MKVLYTHPANPQSRHIDEICATLDNHQAVILPTDTGYVLAYNLKAKNQDAVLLCRDVREMSHYGTISTPNFRILNTLTRNSSTYLLPATKEAPKSLFPNKVVALRLGFSPIVQAVMNAQDAPLVIVDLPPVPAYELEDGAYPAALFVNVADIPHQSSSIVDLTQDTPVLVQEGDSDVLGFFE